MLLFFYVCSRMKYILSIVFLLFLFSCKTTQPTAERESRLSSIKRTPVDSGYEEIRGFVQDVKFKNTQDDGVPFCVVEIFGRIYSGTTADLDGNFVFRKVPPGIYTVQAHAVGFNSFCADSVELHKGEAIHLKIEMEHPRNFIPSQEYIVY